MSATFVNGESARTGNINSGYTVRDGPLGVVRWEWGNVELLTLTLSFPCNRKRYKEISAVQTRANVNTLGAAAAVKI